MNSIVSSPSSTCSFYTRIFTMIFPDATPSSGGFTTPALAGIVIGSVAAVFIAADIVVFLLRSNKEKKESIKVEFNETTTTISSTKLMEEVGENIGDMAKADDDDWI